MITSESAFTQLSVSHHALCPALALLALGYLDFPYFPFSSAFTLEVFLELIAFCSSLSNAGNKSKLLVPMFCFLTS